MGRQGDDRQTRPARLGGDEFAVLLFHASEEKAALYAAERMRDELAKPFFIEGREVNLSASIGVVVSAPTARLPDAMLRAADEAMYRAKVAGKNRVYVGSAEDGDEGFDVST